MIMIQIEKDYQNKKCISVIYEKNTLFSIYDMNRQISIAGIRNENMYKKKPHCNMRIISKGKNCHVETI